MDDARGILRRDLDRRMGGARRGAADQQRDREALAGHFLRHMHHFVERRRDEPGEADDVYLLLLGSSQYLVTGNHDPQVDHIVVVARQYHPDDVLADVVHIALHRRDEEAAVGLGGGTLRRHEAFLLLHERGEVGDRALHDSRALHDLREKHFSSTEEIADDAHAIHQGPLDNRERPGILRGVLPGLLRVDLDELVDSLDEGVCEAFLDRLGAPRQVLLQLGFGRSALGLLQAVGEGHQTLRRVGPAVEENILDPIEQVLGYLLVNSQHSRVDDAHVHARTDGVVEKGRVHRLPHGVVAPERKRHVAHPAGHLCVRKGFLDELDRLEEVDGVIIVLLDPGRDRQDVGVEDDVLRGKMGLLGEQPVGSRANAHLRVPVRCLPLLVEGHHHRRGTVAADKPCPAQEFLLTVLKRYRVYDPLALDALQAGLQDRPFRGVDHDRDPRDLRLRGDQVQELDHRRLAVDQRLVDIDVDQVGPALDLLAGNR